MEKELTKLLEQLALKLGVTVEYLWAVMVKQAMINSIIDIAMSILLILTNVAFFKLYKKQSKDDYGDIKYIEAYAIGGLLLIVLDAVMFFSIGSILTGFLNPEYWALNQILEKLK